MISSNSQPLGGGDPLFVGRHSTMTRPNMMGAVPLYKDQYTSATANSFPLSGGGAGGVSAFPTTDATKTAYGRRDAPPVPNTWKQHPGAVPRSYYPQRQSQVNFLPTRFDFNHAAAAIGDDGAASSFVDWHTTTSSAASRHHQAVAGGMKQESGSLRQQQQQAHRSYRYGPPVPASDRYGGYPQAPPPAPIAARIEQYSVAAAEHVVSPMAVGSQQAAVIGGGEMVGSGSGGGGLEVVENVQSVWSMNAEQLASRQPQKQPGMSHVDFPTPGEIQQALSVAGEFAYHYFHLMQTEPNKLHCFYSNDSQLAHGSSVWEHTKWHRAIGESDIERLFDSVLASKMEGGNSLIVRSNVKTIEAQPTRDGGIVMQATGIIETRDLGSRPFAHTIVMNKAHNEGSYVVLHDIFVFLDDVLQIPPPPIQTAFIPSISRTNTTTTPPPQQAIQHHQHVQVVSTQMIPPVEEPPCINDDTVVAAPQPQPATTTQQQTINIIADEEINDSANNNNNDDDDEEEEVADEEEEEEEEEAPEEEEEAPEEEEEEEELADEEPLEEEIAAAAGAFPSVDQDQDFTHYDQIAAADTESIGGQIDEETSLQREAAVDQPIAPAQGAMSQTSSAAALSEENAEPQAAVVAEPAEDDHHKEAAEEKTKTIQHIPSKRAVSPKVAAEQRHRETEERDVAPEKTYETATETLQPDSAAKGIIEEPPSAAPVNPWRRDEADDEVLSIQEEEDLQEEQAAPVQTEEKPAPAATAVVEEEQPAQPRQSAWKTIHRQPPAAPPIPVAQPEPKPVAAPVVQRQIVPDRVQHELPISLSNHEPNSYVAKLMCGLNNPPPVRGHVLKRSDESASTSPSTRELGTSQEDISGYPCKAVWISQLETFTDAQIEYAVAERLKGCPTEGRVIRIERMRNGPAGMIELDSEDCVPLLLERGLCINGIEVRIDLYKQTPSQIVREPNHSGGPNKLSTRRGGPNSGPTGRGRSQVINREGTAGGAEDETNAPPTAYRGRGWQGPSSGPRGSMRGGNRGGMRGGRAEKLPTHTTHMSSNEEVSGGDWEVVGRSSRRTKSGVYQ